MPSGTQARVPADGERSSGEKKSAIIEKALEAYFDLMDLKLAKKRLADLEKGRALLDAKKLPHRLADEWAHRSITRDLSWGIPLPEIDPDLSGKTLYVWPESLVAPIAFTRLALARRGFGRY